MTQAQALEWLELPFPLIAAAVAGEPDGNIDTAGPGDEDTVIASQLACQRDGVCELRIWTDFPLTTRTELLATKKQEAFKIDKTGFAIFWELGKNGQAELRNIWPASVQANVLVTGAETESSGITLEPYKRLSLYIGSLQVEWQPEMTWPELRMTPQRRDNGAAIIAGCGLSNVTNRWGDWGAALAINPQAGELVEEICSIPPEVMSVKVETAAPASMDAGGTVRKVISAPLDRVMLAFLPGEPQLSDGNDPEVAKLAAQIADQILHDYLTLFHDVPLPTDLDAYVARRPELARPVAPPDMAELTAIASRQPHLTNLYRHRAELGPPVLGDMFRYLVETRLITP